MWKHRPRGVSLIHELLGLPEFEVIRSGRNNTGIQQFKAANADVVRYLSYSLKAGREAVRAERPLPYGAGAALATRIPWPVEQKANNVKPGIFASYCAQSAQKAHEVIPELLKYAKVRDLRNEFEKAIKPFMGQDPETEGPGEWLWWDEDIDRLTDPVESGDAEEQETPQMRSFRREWHHGYQQDCDRIKQIIRSIEGSLVYHVVGEKSRGPTDKCRRKLQHLVQVRPFFIQPLVHLTTLITEQSHHSRWAEMMEIVAHGTSVIITGNGYESTEMK